MQDHDPDEAAARALPHMRRIWGTGIYSEADANGIIDIDSRQRLRERRRRRDENMELSLRRATSSKSSNRDEDMSDTPNLRQQANNDTRPSLIIAEALKSHRLRSQRKRWGLPLFMRTRLSPGSFVMACPDSGSDENIISLELVNSLGLKIEQPRPDERRQFAVANGNIVIAVGQVSTWCGFFLGNPSKTSHQCVFHVFNTLAVPLIMGVDFLQQTETLSKHRNRLVELPVSALQALRLNSVGRPRRSLVCRLDTYVGCATVDTGADLDLVSSMFAKSRAYKIEPAYEQVEFADCSVGCTSGFIKTSFVVGNADSLGFRPRGHPIDLELFVLDNLNADILIGQDTINRLDVFNLHKESFIPSMPRLGESDLNIIRHIGRLEQGAANLWKKIKGGLGGNLSDDGTGKVEAQVDLDQRENARRERERARIMKLPSSAKRRAQELEDTTIRTFESERQGRLSPVPSSTVPPDPRHPLNSHANVRSSTRPYYCPVTGCPRSEGGEGFKTKHDLSVHHQVHDLPGYRCPFCIDQGYKYPRPDNLRRHVRSFHADKDEDDPILQQALSQPSEGPSIRSLASL